MGLLQWFWNRKKSNYVNVYNFQSFKMEYINELCCHYYAIDYKGDYALQVRRGVNGVFGKNGVNNEVYTTCIGNAKGVDITKEEFESVLKEAIEYLSSIKIHKIK